MNTEVVKCDYKIALGSIVPHGFAGFGGGAKIILPGIASFETIRAMHRMKRAGQRRQECRILGGWAASRATSCGRTSKKRRLWSASISK